MFEFYKKANDLLWINVLDKMYLNKYIHDGTSEYVDKYLDEAKGMM